MSPFLFIKLLAALYALPVFISVVAECDGGDGESLKSSKLEFYQPTWYPSDKYPPDVLEVTEGRSMDGLCCVNRHDHIDWYVNGTLVEEDNTDFSYLSDRQIIMWNRASVIGLTTFKCVVIKQGEKSIERSLLMLVEKDCPRLQPHLTRVPKSPCANVGDTKTVVCEIDFGVNKCKRVSIIHSIEFFDSNDKWVASSDNVKQIRIPSNAEETHIASHLTFFNITKEQLEMTYYCYSHFFTYLKGTFKFNTNCSEPVSVPVPTRFDVNLVIGCVIGALLLLLIVIVTTVVCYKNRDTVYIKWMSKIYPTFKGGKKYDAYVICSNDDNDVEFLNQKLIDQLEIYYKLCLPDRDFAIGSVIPKEITDNLKQSKRVLIILGSGKMQEDWCDLAIEVAIANRVPSVFIKTPDANPEDQSLPSSVKAATLASPVLDYPQNEDATSMKDFFNAVYAEMPLVASYTSAALDKDTV